MSDRTPHVITTSASSWLGASLGAEIGSLVVLPIGFLLSIFLRSPWMFYFTLAGWAVFAGTGGYWIRRQRYRFDLQRQVLERHTLWFFRSAHVQRIAFKQINSFEIADAKHGPRLLMLLSPGGRWVIKAGSRQRLEPLRRALSGIVSVPEIAGSTPASPALLESAVADPDRATQASPVQQVAPIDDAVAIEEHEEEPGHLIFDANDDAPEIPAATTVTAATIETIGTLNDVVTSVTGVAEAGLSAATEGAVAIAPVAFPTMHSAEKAEPVSISGLAVEVVEIDSVISKASSPSEEGDAGVDPTSTFVGSTPASPSVTDNMQASETEHGDEAAAGPPVMEKSVVEEQNDAGAESAPTVLAIVEATALAEPAHADAPPSAPTVFPRSDLPSSGMAKLKVGIIGGSGLGQLLAGHAGQSRPHEIHTPFGAPSDAIIETEWAGVPVFLLARHGPGHLLNPTEVPYQANIFALKQLGCTHIIASGAVGSLREEMKPRDLAIPDQIIDKTTWRPGTFYDNTAVHVEFSEPFCPVLRQILVEAGAPAADAAAATHATHDRGCYVVMEGPAFSTRAESLMHRLWGGDLIGMTAMPEAKLAREAEISYAMVALVTDYDCWRQKPPLAPGQPEQKAAPVDPFVLLKEIISNLESASANAMALIRRAIELIASRQEELMKAPSRNALQLAIWSDRRKIPADEVGRLKVLWGRHFQDSAVEGEANNAEVGMQNAE